MVQRGARPDDHDGRRRRRSVSASGWSASSSGSSSTVPTARRRWSRSSRRRPTRAASSRPCSTCTAARSASTRELSARTNDRASRVLLRRARPETQDTVLLLEDVSPRGRLLDQVAGCSVADARPAIRMPRQAARVLLGRPVARRRAVPAAAVRRPVSGRGRVRVRDRVAARAGVLPRPDRRPGARRSATATPRRSRRCSRSCRSRRSCSSHGDWRLDNLFFTPDDDVIAVDWQLIDRSVGPRDLAYFVTESVERHRPAPSTRPRSTTYLARSRRARRARPTRSGRSRCTATARCSASCTR